MRNLITNVKWFVINLFWSIFRPLDVEIFRKVQQLHTSPFMTCTLTTGAGGTLCHDLWRAPGASSTILDHRFLYSQETFVIDVGHTPKSFASEEAALLMAAAAYQRGRELAVRRKQADHPVIGLGMCAAVSTDRERKGSDRANIAIRTVDGFWTVAVEFDKPQDHSSAREHRRAEEGILCDLLVLNSLLCAAGIDPVLLEACGMHSKELITRENGKVLLVPRRVEFGPLVKNQIYWPDGTVSSIDGLDPSKYIILPGSFNPFHHGHAAIARMLEQQTGKRVIFQISDDHPVKGMFDDAELLRRLMQFRYRYPVVVTRGAGLFSQKAALFPGMEILMGFDAAKNLLNPEFYPGSSVETALDVFRKTGSIIRVAGRVEEGTDKFCTLDDLLPLIPKEYEDLFKGVSCREDISSTAIRAQQGC